MVNLETGKMTVDGDNWYPIDRWEVWFMTPFGVLQTLGPAARMLKQRDHDPNLTVVPVTVAISSNNDVEIVRR